MTTYVFEGYELDTRRHELRHEGALVAVEPQVFSVLAYLAAHADRVVDKEELLDAVWQTRFVTESALTSRIKAARRAIGDDGRAQQAIRTIHGRGYRFVAAVTARESQLVAADVDPLLDAELGYCRAADGVRIAYGSTGSGTPLVKAANWLTHLRFDPMSAGMAALGPRSVASVSARSLRRASAAACRTGTSRTCRSTRGYATSSRSSNISVSNGSRCSASRKAARWPRATPLAIPNVSATSCCTARFLSDAACAARSEAERRDAEILLELLETGWGREDSPFGSMFASQFMPEGSPEQWAAFVEVQRRTTSARNARRLMSMSQDIDVTEVAPAVTVPTLVLHATRDRRVPLEQGQLFADLIPRATFVPLESHNHILLGDEPAWKVFVEEVERFISTDG